VKSRIFQRELGWSLAILPQNLAWMDKTRENNALIWTRDRCRCLETERLLRVLSRAVFWVCQCDSGRVHANVCLFVHLLLLGNVWGQPIVPSRPYNGYILRLGPTVFPHTRPLGLTGVWNIWYSSWLGVDMLAIFTNDGDNLQVRNIGLIVIVHLCYISSS